jgi:HK97 family phage major capsid protein
VRHPWAGQLVKEGERTLIGASECDKAIGGAFIKWQIESSGTKIPRALRMTEHDRDLVQYALKEEDWVGVINGSGSEDEGAIGIKSPRKLTPGEQKALIDDATSGGVEAVPRVFDDQMIETPLLNGEFFPFVNVVNITQGRLIDGSSIGNVTISSGGADATAIPLFDTTSFVSAFDTTIFVANGSIELGLDFMSDSPIDIAARISSQYGQQLLTWLDTQICTGDGTTEPDGIVGASGVATPASANGNGGPPTVGDYESLLFGVAKQYRAGTPATRIRYGGTETSYQRARSIAVGASDERRVFGMSHEDYMLLGHPYGIGGGLSNVQLIFGNFARYRMYRRLGITIRTSTEGKELVRGNLMLITARARFGGQIEDGGAFAVMPDAQT